MERSLKDKRARRNLFTLEVLDQQIGADPVNLLFERTIEDRADDKLFADDERINLKPATSRAIVEKLQAYNLSDTSEDVKGIAFERFLGRTFRGEIGQFFTPRPIVEFIVRFLDPQEGEVILDPASGSGGFLIRAFEWVRERLLADADARYNARRDELDAQAGLKEAEHARLLTEAFDASQADLTKRLHHLANNCLFGTDANERMARTSKMNMIMHGDGHGGVHHHNGLLNVNGIFENRFDVILTNPPFGASVETTDKITEDQLKLKASTRRRYEEQYGDAYRAARAALEKNVNKAIVGLFDFGHSPDKPKQLLKQKTEILFVERCLRLLKPGGRLGVVLPESIFNNPSLDNLRRYCEDRARLLAVVSLPPDTFKASGATVKCSVLFIRKFTAAEAAAYAAALALATQERTDHHQPARDAESKRLETALTEAKAAKDAGRLKALRAERKATEARFADTIKQEARALTKQRLDYPFFLYEAERVGITATGETDVNELYDNPTWDPALAGPDTLTLYHEFAADPAAFAAALEAEAEATEPEPADEATAE